MPVPFRDGVVCAPGSVLRPGEIDRLNRLLDDAGLGRPLCHPERRGGGGDAEPGVVLLPLAGADPVAVRDTLRRSARERGAELPDLTPDYRYRVDTVERDTRQVFLAAGKAIGHGTVAWRSAPSYEMPCPPAWRPGADPPVVALLDTRVRAHDWLPGPDPDPPFLVAATDHGWAPPEPVPDPDPDQPGVDLGSHWGHGTFLAGLIRLAAPDAQVLSLPVMDHRGRVGEAGVLAGLGWLARHAGRYRRLVVVMAFGREVDAGDDLSQLRRPLLALARQQVPVVVSAGNDGTEQPPRWPAAFATDPELTVVSVGARVSATERAPFSNYGVWVREWRDGSNVIGPMPVAVTAQGGCPELAGEPETGRFAWWSGTSFAAATRAGELAAGRPAPVPPVPPGPVVPVVPVVPEPATAS
jgi:hypothetical protein